MLHGLFGADEPDTLIELIVAVFFMGICAVAIGLMSMRMVEYGKYSHNKDKLETVADASSVEEPFYYTGYQAYMFAWMMDPYSYTSLSWLDDPTSRTDGTSGSVTIGVLDESGTPRANFMAWRNQTITGGAIAPVRNVHAIVRSAGDSTGNRHNFYAGTTSLKYHLVFTGDYTINKVPTYAHIDHTLIERSKVYTWVLVPETYP